MFYLNKAVLIGELIFIAPVQHSSTGKKYMGGTVSVKETRNDKEMDERIDIIVYGDSTDAMLNAGVGAHVMVEGKIGSRKSKDGAYVKCVTGFGTVIKAAAKASPAPIAGSDEDDVPF